MREELQKEARAYASGPYWRCGDCGRHFDFDGLSHHVVDREKDAWGGMQDVFALESRLVVFGGDDVPGTGFEVFRFICPECGYKDQYPEADHD